MLLAAPNLREYIILCQTHTRVHMCLYITVVHLQIKTTGGLGILYKVQSFMPPPRVGGLINHYIYILL